MTTIPLQSVELTSNPDGDFIAVIRPPFRDPQVIRLALILAFAAVVSIALLQYVLWFQSARGLAGRMDTFIHLYQVGTLIVIGCVLANMLASRWTLNLSPFNLETSHAVLGLTVSRRVFQNSDRKNLRYTHWQTQSRSGTIEQSGIKFEVRFRTHCFGTSVARSDGNELIARMRKRYNFLSPEEGDRN